MARERQKRNLLATLFVAQGVPMLLAGDELGRTQHGNNNAYCQDNEISWLDWKAAASDDGEGMIAFTARACAISISCASAARCSGSRDHPCRVAPRCQSAVCKRRITASTVSRKPPRRGTEAWEAWLSKWRQYAKRALRDAAARRETGLTLVDGRRECARAAAAGRDLPFELRPGLVAEMLRFYDLLRRQSQSVERFEALIVEARGG